MLSNSLQKYEGIRDPKATVLEFLLLAGDHLRELPKILRRAEEIIEELSAPASNPVINNSDRPEVSQSRPEHSQSSQSQHDLPASADSGSTDPFGLGPPTRNGIREQLIPEPPEPGTARSGPPGSAEPNLGRGPLTHDAVIEPAVLERSSPGPSEPNPVQPDAPFRPDHTEPYGPARLPEPPAATEAWANHTKDLHELTEASINLLAEVKFVQDAVCHCNIILCFHQLTWAQ